MPITLTCPSCGQQCAVKEEYAGMQVRCPRCPGVISVPAAVPAVAIADAEPVAVMPASSAPPPLPDMSRGQAGPGFMNNVTAFLAANGVSGVNFILFLVGVGCLAFFLITILLPWTPSMPGFAVGGVTVGGGSVLGIALLQGLLYFFMTLGITFLLVFVILMGWSSLFDYALWTASNYSIFVALHLLIMVRVGGWGLILALIVMLGAAGTLSVVAFSRLFTRPSVR